MVKIRRKVKRDIGHIECPADPITGIKIKLKIKSEKDKIKDILGDNVIGIHRSGNELTIYTKEDIKDQDKDKIEKIANKEAI